MQGPGPGEGPPTRAYPGGLCFQRIPRDIFRDVISESHNGQGNTQRDNRGEAARASGDLCALGGQEQSPMETAGGVPAVSLQATASCFGACSSWARTWRWWMGSHRSLGHSSPAQAARAVPK